MSTTIPPNAFNFPKLAYLEHPELPRLPLPSLDETLDKYIKTVANLLTPEDLEKTKAVVEEFRRTDGPLLHQKLLEHVKEAPTSWLEGWWDSMYLEIRDPNPIWTNPFFILEDDPFCHTQASRAASLIVSSLKFYQKIVRKQLDQDFERKTPLCMSQYGRLYTTSRIPGNKRDKLVTTHDSKHIAIVSRGQFYYFNVLDENNDIMLEKEIEKSIQQVIDETHHSKNRYPPLGLFTAEERDTWAKVYSDIERADPANAESLRVIKESLFVVCLEDNTPRTLDEYASQLLHSDGKNRWFDKTFQFIVFPNSKAGINMEHSGYDGHTMVRHIREVCRDARSRKQNNFTNFSKILLRSRPIRLEWNIPASVLTALQEADHHFRALTNTTQTTVMTFDKFGKEAITKHKVSPDAFIQLGFQLTYLKLFGRIDSTYESGMTKQFYHGRTETVRPVTADSVAFCKAFLSKSVSDDTKEALLRKAAATHVKTANEAKNGHGVDRHLYGMQWLAKYRIQMIANYQMPALYTDKAYPTMKTDLMSTSSLYEPALLVFGFGPTAAKGLGLGYTIYNNSITVNVTSFIGQAKMFSKALSETFLQLKEFLDENAKRRPESAASVGEAPRAKL